MNKENGINDKILIGVTLSGTLLLQYLETQAASNDSRNCFKSYSEHVLILHNLLFRSGPIIYYMIQEYYRLIEIIVNTTLAHSHPPIKGAAGHL